MPPFYPFERREENGTVYHFGRGSVDAKGPVATMIVASHKFFQSRTDTPSLGMLFVVSEEIGGAGMKAFAQVSIEHTIYVRHTLTSCLQICSTLRTRPFVQAFSVNRPKAS